MIRQDLRFVNCAYNLYKLYKSRRTTKTARQLVALFNAGLVNSEAEMLAFRSERAV